MKFLRAVFSGLVAFVGVATMTIIVTYLKCLDEGIPYYPPIMVPIAMKTGVIAGIAIFLLTLGSLRRRPPF